MSKDAKEMNPLEKLIFIMILAWIGFIRLIILHHIVWELLGKILDILAK